jgi:ParB/RepB/Spo0J family partition protein
MPKLEPMNITQKISLAQIIDTGNIREKEKYGPGEKGEYPEEIKELAESIRKNGQIQPVVVKFAGEKDGLKQYELIAGFRRRAAFEYLCSKGDDFNMINASIVTGDKLIIQLVENIQREDLSAPEREKAIYQLAESGLKQTEIAAQLSKPKSYISVHLSAYKMRVAAEKAGVDLKGVETSTLRELLGIPEENIISILDELVRMGGTGRDANYLARHFKGKEDPPPESPEPPAPGGDIDPLATEKKEDAPPEPPPPEEKRPEPKPQTPIERPEPIEADHRIIDVNIILTLILEYINAATGDKQEAAKDILALIHKEIDRA